jgi:cold shock protein
VTSTKVRRSESPFYVDPTFTGFSRHLHEAEPVSVARGEETLPEYPENQDRVGVEDIRDCTRAKSVVPGIEIPPEPLRKPAGIHKRIPELALRIDWSGSEVNYKRIAFPNTKSRHGLQYCRPPGDMGYRADVRFTMPAKKKSERKPKKRKVDDRVGGVVRDWDDEEGWGIVDTIETPGGCFVHFSAIVGTGYRNLHAGERVTLTFAGPGLHQDGYDCVARQVWQEETFES